MSKYTSVKGSVDHIIELEDQVKINKIKPLKQLTLTQMPYIFPVPSPKKTKLKKTEQNQNCRVFTQNSNVDESDDNKSESLLSNNKY